MTMLCVSYNVRRVADLSLAELDPPECNFLSILRECAYVETQSGHGSAAAGHVQRIHFFAMVLRRSSCDLYHLTELLLPTMNANYLVRNKM